MVDLLGSLELPLCPSSARIAADPAPERNDRLKFSNPWISEKLPAAAVVPDYPLGCKRILISNDYYKTLLRPNVTWCNWLRLSKSPRPMFGAPTAASFPLDVLLLGTGFESTEFLAPMSFVAMASPSMMCGRQVLRPT